ncbi:hypothetical protein [Paramicrobacterium fandaimingii]|uniref:hypothetical protein n=1 Tax=Paramicrobacterium fandaimingii TaxID=2708079 RepID=UPI0014243A72|nr:hypothetical protein [Microbacterium fandaimingii]
MEDERTPTIEELLVPFFIEQTAGKTGKRLRRVQEVERHLREYLQTAGHRILTTWSLGILNLERQFHPDDAFIRCMHADDLLYTLATFIEPAWLSDDRIQARVQVGIAEKLMLWLRENGLVTYADVSCELQRLVVAIYRVKRAQRTEEALRRLGEIRR